MDSKADQPLLDPTQRQASYIHAVSEGKDFGYSTEPKMIEQIEHIELRDADVVPTATGTGGQGETIQVTTTETCTSETKKCKKNKCPKHPSDAKPLTMGLNMFDRDEKNINGQVHIMFDDVLAEPDGAHSFDPIWKGTYIFFQWTKVWIYRLLSLVFGLPLAFIWGIIYAITTAIHVFVFTPFYKLFSIFFCWIGRMWGTIFRELFYPVFDSVGRCFSDIRMSRGPGYNTVGTNTMGKTTANLTGVPEATWSTQPIIA